MDHTYASKIFTGDSLTDECKKEMSTYYLNKIFDMSFRFDGCLLGGYRFIHGVNLKIPINFIDTDFNYILILFFNTVCEQQEPHWKHCFMQSKITSIPKDVPFTDPLPLFDIKLAELVDICE